ncbi:hypothetical protein M408DRAFT_330608 [Serendipita vermifera MAFF 305830]|uniref:Uncharacterized protein n=1 Tax=Serendipita vermifera MAFF 305830 TaxID=933852 RepID=A0A0C3B2N5_SERVB|nr:hypothetical protein M408DRAFT_330608 [Serendipita vermifera MAFF 305830]
MNRLPMIQDDYSGKDNDAGPPTVSLEKPLRDVFPLRLLPVDSLSRLSATAVRGRY